MGSLARKMLAVLAAAAALCAPAAAATYAKGIDVSNYQKSINWNKVSAAGYQFAFAKATEGTTFNDAFYAANREGTEGLGMRFGAYHFARPAGTSAATILSSAIAQADHLVEVAQPQPGELPPVLDLEATGSLSTTNLQAWARAWLDEVYARTGVNALVYASPAFWKKYLGDTTAEATAGNKLWIAHWTTNASPTLPAQKWGGLSWLFWQWSDCLHVPGITTGCVDGDRFNGPDATVAGIPPFPSGAPVASIPPTIVGAAQSGKVLAGIPGGWTGGKPVAFLYQWLRCDAAGASCIPITNAIAEKYTPGIDDIGHALVVTVTTQSSSGVASASSPPTVAIGASGSTSPSRPASTSAPTVSGTVQAGQVLTSSVGTWTGSPTSFAYQWRRCDGTGNACGAIPGAVNSSYTVSPGDIGSTMSLVVTATGSGGSQAALSAPTAVAAAAPVPAPVQESLVAQPGQAGAVVVADGRATVTFQPGAVPDQQTVTLTAAEPKYALHATGLLFGVTNTPTLAWPVDIAYASAPAGAVVGISNDGIVWQPAAKLSTPTLPPAAAAGTYFDGTLLHVLTRTPSRIALFTAGSWGDPSLVAAGPPTVTRTASFGAKRQTNGSVLVYARVSVASQSHLYIGLVGGPIRQQTLLLKPGPFSVRLTVRAKRGTVGHLRVAAIDPYGRKAALILAYRVP
ncbi:MAG TPA: glycoside hydrolase family 25 protein [Gaiellaceae bacterium]|nr:glycoside hydrolase family 25 protein [Gaiellaceae bacterium]